MVSDDTFTEDPALHKNIRSAPVPYYLTCHCFLSFNTFIVYLETKAFSFNYVFFHENKH